LTSVPWNIRDIRVITPSLPASVAAHPRGFAVHLALPKGSIPWSKLHRRTHGMNRRRIFAGISVITMCVLMFELGLTRIFSATMYYHFAFLAISLALFGSGASGVFIYMIQRRLTSARTGEWLGLASQLFAITTLIALSVVLTHPVALTGAAAQNFRTLAIIYAATTLPFFFAGCVITLAVTRFASDMSRLYLFDLAGAAMGCLLFIPVLNLIGAINTVLLVSAGAAIASVIFCAPTIARRSSVISSWVLAAGFVALPIYNIATHRLDITVSKMGTETEILFSKWNSFSRITVRGNLDRGDANILIDSDAATQIIKDAGNKAAHPEPVSEIKSIAYRLKHDANVLIIGPGGGDDVMAARATGMKAITAVEINPIIARDVMSSEPFKSFSGAIYEQPGVRLVVDEGRSFIRSSKDRYDIIQATLVDTWAATGAGAFALTENNLYTVEAFKDYVTHLTNDGLLTMTRWYFEPPDQTLRLLSISRAMMSELGIQNPARHVMLVVQGDGANIAPATFILKKSEFTEAEVRTIENIAAINGFTLLYTPLTRPPNAFTKMMEAPNPAQVWAKFETNVAPTYDNNPFFFNTVRLSNLGSLRSASNEGFKNNVGTFLLFSLFAITVVMVIVFIFGPLILFRRSDLATGGPSKISYLLYFACLGAGFIIVEVAMIQKFILFLGHPVYALTVILFSLLTFSALGSYLSGRLFQQPRVPPIMKLLGLVAVVIIVYTFALPPLFYGLVHWPHPVRIIIAVVVMAPLAALMGMPMPLAIRLVSRTAPELIPWAWGVNGATSVMGSVAALAIAISSGFYQALFVGAALYLLACVFLIRTKNIENKTAAVTPALSQAQPVLT
jgi:predicted membrane-bound spermidine synthase